jgi:hypothetical protein
MSRDARQESAAPSALGTEVGEGVGDDPLSRIFLTAESYRPRSRHGFRVVLKRRS